MDFLLVITLSIFIQDSYAGYRTVGYNSNDRSSKNSINSIIGNVTREGDMICKDKLMMVEYTDFTEVTTCVHNTDTQCHDTFVTKFVPHQEQECEEKYEKTCSIHYDKVSKLQQSSPS